MTFLNDLDAVAWAAMFAAAFTFLISAFLSYYDWQNKCRVEVAKRAALLWIPVLLFVIGACASYSSKANAPRKSIEGVVQYVGERHGKGSYTVFICATSCQLTGGYTLALHDRPSRAVKVGADYRFTYLEEPIGSVYTGTWLTVVDAVDPESGEVVYALDIANHPYRIVAYLLDAMLMVLAVLFAGWLRRKQLNGKGKERDPSDEDDTREKQLDERIPGSLGLE